MLDDPNNPLNLITWQRGFLLGMALVALFGLGALLIFVLLSLLGMAWRDALIVSVLLGPVVGIGVFGTYWLVKRPQLSTIPAPPDRDDKDEDEDEDEAG